MIRRMPCIIVSLLFASAWSLYAVPDGNNTIITSLLDTQIFELEESEELFEDCPSYRLDNPRQTIMHNGLKANDDYNFHVRTFWNRDSIFFRIDVVDDVFIPVPDSRHENAEGDYVRINFAHLTCGPDRNSRQPWSIYLYPDVDAESCALRVDVDSETTKAKIGRIKSGLLETIDGYAIIVKLPFEKWDDLPRSGGQTRVQVYFHDSDEEGVANHQFTLFPLSRKEAASDHRRSNFGTMRYAERQWVSVYPHEIIAGSGKAEFFIDAGNRTDRDAEAVIYLEDAKTGAVVEVDGETYGETVLVGSRSQEQKSPVTFDFEGVPSGTFKVGARIGVFYDSGAFTIVYSADSGNMYCPDLIERRRKVERRVFAVNQREETRAEAFHRLAGGGDLIWHAGVFDASSEDFPQYIRGIGKTVINVPGSNEKDVPWALFGGLDVLDGMNEPLTLAFDRSLEGVDDPFFPPDDPLLQSKQNMPRAQREKIKYLLLFGVIVDNVDNDSFPEIRISSGGKTLTSQVLQPSKSTTGRKRHTYITRTWLKNLDGEIAIENTAQYGHRLEIDFIALLKGRDGAMSDATTPSLAFKGSSEAEAFTKMVGSSAYLMANYLIDQTSQPYSSLPGGRHDFISLRDWGLLMSELSAWGYAKDAARITEHLPLYISSVDANRPHGQFSIGSATVITGIYNTWRKLGANSGFLDSIWLPCVHRPITEIVREIETNPLGLVNCTGELGSYDGLNPAATVPMYFAIQSALGSAAALAEKSGYNENARSWRFAADQLERNFKEQLVSVDNAMQLVTSENIPASWGIDEQHGIVSSLPPSAWLYGRYEDGKPVFYNRDLRVFDTPYLLSGMSFWCDYYGFSLDDDMRAQLKSTYDYILSVSPLFKKPAWSKYYIVDYNSNIHQLWSIIAGQLLDSGQLSSTALRSYIRYTHDEFLDIPASSDIEVSPYTFEEKFNVAADGGNLGSTLDDLNVINGTTALKMARIVGGIDDTGESLRLAPRLPTDWEEVEAKNWIVSNADSDSGLATIQYSYRRLGDDRYVLTLDSSEKLDSITVRLGPFPSKIRKVRVTGGGQRVDANTFRQGFNSWVEQTFKKVRSLEISSQAIIY